MSPREFLRRRRPERFSDTPHRERPRLARPLLEYQLDSITSRSQELAFENFARRIAERVVCPNLIPHTGPTGGGDSKVDTETFPVSDQLALAWFIGEQGAAKERWAFAFSAKKDWRPKVKADIAAIAATGRGYRKAIFISSRFIKDKDRAKIEDELSKKHSLRVSVFDRSWIIEQVFQHRLEDVAAEELGLEGVLVASPELGPQDLQNAKQLGLLEERLAAALAANVAGPPTVDLAIRSADLARRLERPRVEVDGRYERARRLAVQCGTTYQQLTALYEHAGTTFWWYEDYNTFLDKYSEVAAKADELQSPGAIEKWFAVFQLFTTAVRATQGEAADKFIKEEGTRFLKRLYTIAADGTRPSFALQAETDIVLVQANLAQEFSEAAIRRLKGIVRRAKALIGYPVTGLFALVIDLGDQISENEAYERLVDEISELSAARDGEIAAASVLVRRGGQLLEAGKPYEAIKVLGRALGRLYKNETSAELVRALYLCASAYEQVGLLWAARGTVLSALMISMNTFWNHERVTKQQASCMGFTKWIELKLGRLGPCLAWHDVHQAAVGVIIGRGGAQEELLINEPTFEMLMGVQFLRADLWTASRLDRLPASLDRIALTAPAQALRFALGCDQTVPKWLSETGELQGDDAVNFFKRWRDFARPEDLLQPLEHDWKSTVTLSSRVLGCLVTVRAPNAGFPLRVGEAFLGALEAFLATGVLMKMSAFEPTLTANVIEDSALDKVGIQVTHPDGRPHIEIKVPAVSEETAIAPLLSRTKQEIYRSVVEVLPGFMTVDDVGRAARQLFRDEDAPARAMDFGANLGAVNTMFGATAKLSLNSWMPSGNDVCVANRNEEWDGADRVQARPNRRVMADPTARPPAELLVPGSTSHHQIATVSLIRMRLWEEAGWMGVGYSWEPDRIPEIILVFKNPEVGARILDLLRQDLADQPELLRLAIIRGVSRRKPTHYRVIVGSDPRFMPEAAKQSLTVYRVHEMTPPDTSNLDRFLAAFAARGEFVLSVTSPAVGMARYRHALQRAELAVREAWEVGVNDIDSTAIYPGDDPIVPPGMKNPPIVALLKGKEAKQAPRKRKR